MFLRKLTNCAIPIRNRPSKGTKQKQADHRARLITSLGSLGGDQGKNLALPLVQPLWPALKLNIYCTITSPSIADRPSHGENGEAQAVAVPSQESNVKSLLPGPINLELMSGSSVTHWVMALAPIGPLSCVDIQTDSHRSILPLLRR